MFEKILGKNSTSEVMVELQQEAAKKGKDEISMEEIEQEIEDYRNSS